MMSLSNRSHFLAILIIVFIGSCAENPSSEGYSVKGTINGVKNGKVKLMKSNLADRTTTTVDSGEVNEGNFSLKGKVASPEMMSLVIEPGNWSLELFMENSDITLKADTSNSTHYDWTAYGGAKGAQMKEYTVTGSENHEQWAKYENDPALKIYEPLFIKLSEEYKAAAGNKEEAYKIKDRIDSLRTHLTALQKKWIDSFVTANPSSAAGAYLVNYYYMFNEDMPLKDLESLTAKLDGTAKSTVYFNSLSDDIKKRKALQPGNVAPDFTLLKPDSSSFTLSSLRGKYVLLDFWASWCVPCRKAIPHWKKVYEQFHEKGFEIVGVTNDSKWSDWFKALEQEKMPWLQVADEFPVENMPSRVGTMYMTPYLPTYILLDREGKIVLHNASKEQIDSKLKELL